MMTGVALEEGLIASIEDPMSDYLPDVNQQFPDKADITIRDLLTMQSGIDYENDGAGGETHQVLQQNPANLTTYILGRPLVNDPGTHFYYKDGDPQLMAAIIQESGKPADEFMDEMIFSKIGFSNYRWVRYRDETTLGGFGIETTPRELAKLALLVLDSGRWNGEELIPSSWIAQMTSPQVEIDSENYDFGYYWWIDKKEKIHFMWGHGGQFAFVVPEKQLVIVMTSFPNTQGDYQVLADEALPLVYDIMNISD